jgi:ribosome-associated protein
LLKTCSEIFSLNLLEISHHLLCYNNAIMKIRITNNIYIYEKELNYEFIRSSGPGGQNVNKVATAVKLKFDAQGSPNLPDGLKERLRKIAGSRMTESGIIIIDARNHRTQEKNRSEALERLIDLLSIAAIKPKTRRLTRPTQTARQRRLDDKHHRSKKLQDRTLPEE